MRRNGEPTHLRLVRPALETEADAENPFTAKLEEMRAIVRRLDLPFSGDRLWLRMLPCTCGGVKLYYVKIIALDNIREHRPYLCVMHSHAEEIAFSRHVAYKFIHKLFRVSLRNVVLRQVFKLQKELLRRDYRLHQARATKEFFDAEFGLSPKEMEHDVHHHH